MATWRRDLFLVATSQFLALAGFWFAMPFIPYYIQELGVTDVARRNLWISIYTVIGYLTYCVSAPLWGMAADRWGKRLMLLRANFCGGIIVTAMAFVPGVGWLVFLRFLMGVFSGATAAAQTLVSGNTPDQRQGFALGALSSALYAGTMAGCFFGGIAVDHFGYRKAFLVGGALFLLAGIMALGTREPPSRRRVIAATPEKDNAKARASFASITGVFDFRRYRSARPPAMGYVWGLLGSLTLISVAQQFDTAFLPLRIKDVHGQLAGAATWTGMVSCATAAAGILAGIVFGRLADRAAAVKIATLATLFAGLLMFPQGYVDRMGVLLATRCGMVFCVSGLVTMFQAWLAKATPIDRRGAVFGWATSAMCVGWAAAGAISGTIATLFSLRAIYLVGCLIYFALIPLVRKNAAGQVTRQ